MIPLLFYQIVAITRLYVGAKFRRLFKFIFKTVLFSCLKPLTCFELVSVFAVDFTVFIVREILEPFAAGVVISQPLEHWEWHCCVFSLSEFSWPEFMGINLHVLHFTLGSCVL